MFTINIKNYIILYGEHSIGSNVHNLSHIIEDMKANNIGNLMKICTYRFENCLRLLGLNLKHGRLPLEQISRRVIESSRIDLYACRPNKSMLNENVKFINLVYIPQVSYESKLLPENRKIYHKIHIASDVTLSSRKSADSWFLTNSNDIVKMKYVIEEGNIFKVVGHRIDQKISFFEKPIDSSKLYIYRSNCKITDELHVYILESIVAKMMCLPYDGDDAVFLPVLHTMEVL